MNLVAKEFVAAQGEAMARGSGDVGALVLSEFAGAARDLPDALIINPYDTDEFADAIRSALEMPVADRRERMARMYEHLTEHNIYRWAADFLKTLSQSRRMVAAQPRGADLKS